MVGGWIEDFVHRLFEPRVRRCAGSRLGDEDDPEASDGECISAILFAGRKVGGCVGENPCWGDDRSRRCGAGGEFGGMDTDHRRNESRRESGMVARWEPVVLHFGSRWIDVHLGTAAGS